MVAFAAVVLAFTGCTGGELPSNYYMNVTPNTNQSVAASTTAVNFTVSANVVWEVYVDGDLKHTGTAGDNLTYQLTMPANESLTDAVVYNVVFKSADLAYNRTIPVTVTQRAAIDPSQPYLEVSPDADQNVDATTTSFVFTVEANVSWTVKVDGTQQDSGSADKSVTVTFPVNESTTNTAVRVVTFESADPSFIHTVTVNITQAAATPVGPTNMVANPSFEAVTGGEPDSWTRAGNTSSWELVTTGAKDGNNAIKIIGSSGDRCDMKQAVTGITAGKTYEVSFWYKDNTQGATNQGVRIWAAFTGSDGKNITPADVLLQPAETLAPVTSWTEYKVNVVAPAGAEGFNFEIRATKNNSGIIDLCSITEK